MGGDQASHSECRTNDILHVLPGDVALQELGAGGNHTGKPKEVCLVVQTLEGANGDGREVYDAEGRVVSEWRVVLLWVHDVAGFSRVDKLLLAVQERVA